MSDFIKGEVQFVSKSEKAFYSLKVDGEWYGFGRKKPEADKGNIVSFTFSTKGTFKMIDDGSLTIIEKSTAPSLASVGGGSGNTRDDYWTKKAETDKAQQRIREYHAARGSAVDMLNALVNAGAVKLPQTENKRYDALLALCDELTERNYENITERFYGTESAVELDAKAEEE